MAVKVTKKIQKQLIQESEKSRIKKKNEISLFIKCKNSINPLTCF